MENKNNIGITVVVGLVGILIGWLIWGQRVNSPQSIQSNTSARHMMPDGSMMGGDSNSMAGMMANMNAGLQGKTGDAFDQEFLAEMIVHHQGAIDMAKLALTNAKHQEIKDLATAIISAQTKEIGEMKVWQKAWYNK